MVTLEFEGRELVRLAAAKEAEVYVWDDDKVVRLLRREDGMGQLEREEVAMQTVAGLGGPAPATHGTVTIAGRPGLIMDRLHGSDLASMVLRQPWRAAAFGHVLGDTQARLNEIRAPEEAESMRDLLLRSILANPSLADDLRVMAKEALEGLPDGDRVCHGDFHPANVIIDRKHGPVVIDWPNACRGDYHGDVARTLLLLRHATPPEMPAFARPLLAAVRARSVPAYLRAYRRRLPLDPSLVRLWQVAWAARRFSEGLPHEHAAMERVIRRGGDRIPA